MGTQRSNGRQVLQAVSDRAHNKGWGRDRARRVARICICCCMTESNLWIYANGNNSQSLQLPHDKIGWDHASVGMFQQQVPSWGTTADCMDPKKSCHKFMDALANKGMDQLAGPALRLRIQAVQVSFDPGGWNYAANMTRSWYFLVSNWNYKRMAVKT